MDIPVTYVLSPILINSFVLNSVRSVYEATEYEN